MKSEYKIYGLKNATPEDIAALKKKHPSGAHVTHKRSGYELPHNGVFYSNITPALRSWAKLD
jgi:hypothetical protein